MINKDDRILIIGAHPDDEVLGCGGTVSRLSYQYGNDVQISALILSEGLRSREGYFTKDELDKVIVDSIDAAKIIGINNSYFENLPCNRLDSMDLLDIIKIVEKHIDKMQPTIIFTHHYSDINIAHRITYQAVLTACRPLGNYPVKKILSFEIASSTEWAFPYHQKPFSPNVFFEINKIDVENKIKAMEAYTSEHRKPPHPRSSDVIKAVALKWGSVAHMAYAEPFEIIYQLCHIESMTRHTNH